MKIGIVVHSFTGNTLSVAQKLQEVLIEKGNAVTIEQIRAVGETQQTFENIKLEKVPDISSYDVLIICAPVRGFSLSPIMKSFLDQTKKLEGKKAAGFVTHFFPFAWMGGNSAIAQMKSICASKGMDILETGIINWSGFNRVKQINDTIKKLSSHINK
jgi:NAD(P)H dehydrogenase (quinone)